MKPVIATVLDDGTYGQREMTDDEYAYIVELGWTENAHEEATEE